MKPLKFTAHAVERMCEFRISKEETDEMINCSDKENNYWSKRRNARNARMKVEIRRFGPYIFTIQDKPDCRLLITVYNQELEVKL